jgi:hypothetical protein
MSLNRLLERYHLLLAMRKNKLYGKPLRRRRVASSVPKVPKERQVAASLSLLRKGLYSPSMLTDQLDAMVATGKVSYEELDKFEDANAQKDLKESARRQNNSSYL